MKDVVPMLMFVAIGAVVFGAITLAFGRALELGAAIGGLTGLAMALYARRLERDRTTAGRR